VLLALPDKLAEEEPQKVLLREELPELERIELPLPEGLGEGEEHTTAPGAEEVPMGQRMGVVEFRQ
jgi:hypothetical protein